MNKNKKIFKKQKIVEAAAKIFSRDGLERARVEDIAKEAGIGKGTVYLYFPDKESILEEGIRYFAYIRIDQLRSLLSTYKSPKKKLITLLNLSTKIAETDRYIFFMNYAALLSTHKDLRQRAVTEFFGQYVDLVAEIIKEGIASGEFRRINSKVAALSVVLVQDIGNLLLSKVKSGVSSERTAKELLKMIEND
ncbi:TetR/AcrR family transcriptional regulator [Candidatus Dojkabacteria bacterium]|nr:TetR/AcrR family transcriptional regulator [Candidatus Dojkabacteria bacterium]